MDTALAHRLLEAGLVDPLILQGCLGEVRQRRDFDPDVSLALLLVERRLVPPAELDGILYGHHVTLEGSSADLLPNRFGEFEVVRELDRGGMGAVLEVKGPQGNRLALKTLLPGKIDPEMLARFRREAELTAQLDHPHVIRIHAADLNATPPYLVLDQLPGGSLQGRLDREEGGLELEEALSIGLKLTSALAHAHSCGVLHRDLKPENVLFDDRGEPRVIDWGLSRSVSEVSQHLTRTGTLLGTPAYMAPEQALASESVGPPADVYSLGAILFAMICGEPPFSSPALLGLLDKVIHDPPPAPSSRADLGALAPAVDALLARLLAKEPSSRPRLGALADELRGLLRGEGAAAPRRRGGLLLAVTGGLLLLLGLGVAAALGLAPDPALERQRYLEWELRHLSGYSLGVAPIPSALHLEEGLQRLDEVESSLPDAQRALSRQRLEAHRGLLRLQAGDSSPTVSGAPGAVLTGVVALRSGKLRATQRAAKRALALTHQAGPERSAAQLLLVLSAGDLRELVRLRKELAGEEGPLAEGIDRRGAELLTLTLVDFPREGEGWSTGTRRLNESLTLARSLKLPPEVWWQALGQAALRWKSRLGSLSRLAEAEDLALALERLDPPGLGPDLRQVFQNTIDEFAERSQRLNTDSSKRTRMHETLAIALALDGAVAYVDPDYTVSPKTKLIACGQHNSLDPGTTPELSTACALFALRNADDLSVNDIQSHINGPTLKLLLARQPRPRSSAQGLARLLEFSRLRPEGQPVGILQAVLETLTRLLDAESCDLSPSVQALTSLWVADLYEELSKHPSADKKTLYASAADWAKRALAGLPPRKRAHNTVEATKHVARLAISKGGNAKGIEVWTPILGELREGYVETSSTPESKTERLSLVSTLISVARLHLALEHYEVALRLSREAERLSFRRYAWENWLPQAYALQARVLKKQNKLAAAWEALHVSGDLFGASQENAELTLQLGVDLDKKAEATDAYHEAFEMPFPLHERNSRRRPLCLSQTEREHVLALALQLGYPEPPKPYRPGK